MKKKYIVKENRKFQNIINNGKYKKNKSFIIYSMNNNLSYNKYGISVGKKHGNAVFRNKYKRKIRAIIDNCKKDYNIGKDYIIILRRGAIGKSFDELKKDYIQLI